MGAGETAADCTICINRQGAIRILADTAGWTLPALAADLGAARVFRVERRGRQVSVEGWSNQGSCVLRRDGGHATHRPAPLCWVSRNDLSPQVWNS